MASGLPILPALIEAAAASLASLEAIEKGAQQSVADTAAAYARVSADLLVGQARSGTDAGATLLDVAKGMVESAIRGAVCFRSDPDHWRCGAGGAVGDDVAEGLCGEHDVAASLGC